MAEINKKSTILEVAAIVSDALNEAGIAATLSGGGAVSVYTNNEYESKDLDFVTAALLEDLVPVMRTLGFTQSAGGARSEFDHADVSWYVDFVAAPLSFGNLHADHKDAAIIDLGIARLRIITPTQSVMDRLAAAFHWNDPQSRAQAVQVATIQEIDWQALKTWFADEDLSADEFVRFRDAVERNKAAKG